MRRTQMRDRQERDRQTECPYVAPFCNLGPQGHSRCCPADLCPLGVRVWTHPLTRRGSTVHVDAQNVPALAPASCVPCPRTSSPCPLPAHLDPRVGCRPAPHACRRLRVCLLRLETARSPFPASTAGFSGFPVPHGDRSRVAARSLASPLVWFDHESPWREPVFPRSLRSFTNAPQHPVGCAGSLMLPGMVHTALASSCGAVPSGRMPRTALASGPRPCPRAHAFGQDTILLGQPGVGVGGQAASGLRQ